MNLGQHIGRLLLRIAELEDAAIVPVRRISKHSGNGNTALLRVALSQAPEGLTIGQLHEMCGFPSKRIGSYLSMMKDVEKSGARGQYVYRLKVG